MAMSSEMACAYAALILADDGLKVSVDGIRSILKAADVHVESVWPELFVNALESVDVRELVSNIGGGFGGGSVAAGAVAPAAAEAPSEGARQPEKKEEKKEESESDEELGLSLFD